MEQFKTFEPLPMDDMDLAVQVFLSPRNRKRWTLRSLQNFQNAIYTANRRLVREFLNDLEARQ